MRDHEINKDNHFIMAWYAEEGDDLSILDDIVSFHKETANLVDGKSWHRNDNDQKAVIDKNVKDSKDSNLSEYPLSYRKRYYEDFLQPLVDRYKQKYPQVNELERWGIGEDGNVQWYPIGGGFKKWHAEKGSSNPVTQKRVLVYMTYLNDVTDGGETEFYYQNIAIKPKKGLTVIWYPDWTHTHRGVPSPTQEKMIVTGWYSYV